MMPSNNMKQTKQKRQIVKPGDVVAIHLPNGKWMYGRQNKNSTGFYDYVTDELIDDISTLKDKKVLFDVDVYVRVLSSGVWPKIGKIPYEGENDCEGSVHFISHFPPHNTFQYIHNSNPYGNPSYTDCYDLEVASAWNQEHIEIRLMHYTETGRDHPRMWDKWFTMGMDLKTVWEDLYDFCAPIDVVEWRKKRDELLKKI
jgi:hypothetical protein